MSKVKDIQETFNCDEEQAKDIKKLFDNWIDEKIDKQFEVPF